jgi:hypothetical protein
MFNYPDFNMERIRVSNVCKICITDKLYKLNLIQHIITEIIMCFPKNHFTYNEELYTSDKSNIPKCLHY